MLKFILNAFFSISLATIANGQSTPTAQHNLNDQSTPTAQHNLNDIDKINVTVPISESPNPTIAKIGDFIWLHWTERTKGYAEMTLYSKEGDQSKWFINIEPDEKGIWRVAMRIERKMHDRRFVGDSNRMGETIYQTYNYEAYAVEQVKFLKGKTNSKLNRQITDSQLRFKDKNEKVIYEW